MYFYIYKGVIYNLDKPLKIGDFKKYFIFTIFNKKNYLVDNIKVSYENQDETFVPNDKEVLFPYVLYNISIVPINCEKHLK